MKVEYKTAKGVSRLNEDSLIINKDELVYGVADGVSSLVPFTSRKNLTGGYIASNEVKQHFESNKKHGDLFSGVSRVNQRIQDEMKKYDIDISKKETLWGTALALLKITDTSIEYIQTGDCMLIAVYNNDETRVLTRLQVEHLESSAIQKWKEGIEQGVKSKSELTKRVKDILISNRHKSNTEDGYGVLNGEQNAMDYVEIGSINKIGIKQLILMTDGMFYPEEVVPGGMDYWKFITSTLNTKGLDQYVNDLVNIEESDPECIAYPRFKKSDDKAAIIITF
ncbi:protein phosphatase 2C domain-containing protein [Virgibacillus phasianinus]|nr:protein phosphatase 2C domain-containing protein [Virgibacillus phasianinus]